MALGCEIYLVSNFWEAEHTEITYLILNHARSSFFTCLVSEFSHASWIQLFKNFRKITESNYNSHLWNCLHVFIYPPNFLSLKVFNKSKNFSSFFFENVFWWFKYYILGAQQLFSWLNQASWTQCISTIIQMATLLDIISRWCCVLLSVLLQHSSPQSSEASLWWDDSHSFSGTLPCTYLCWHGAKNICGIPKLAPHGR